MMMIRRGMRLIALALIRMYQYMVSPFLPMQCRYAPTCSEYTCEVITRFGLWRGGWMAIRRLSRCHPFAVSGWDPVPEKKPGKTDEEISR